jgi:hypothetical protein
MKSKFREMTMVFFKIYNKIGDSFIWKHYLSIGQRWQKNLMAFKFAIQCWEKKDFFPNFNTLMYYQGREVFAYTFG